MLADDELPEPLSVGTTVDLSVATVGVIRDVAAVAVGDTYVAVEDQGLWVLQGDGKTIEKVSSPVESIVALATDGSTYFIGADDGVFAGRAGDWVKQLNAMISALCIQPEPPVYLAGGAHGMWRSSDGVHWSAVPFPDHRVLKCTIAGSVGYAGTTDGLYQSADSGQTWAAASLGVGTRYIPGVAVGSGSVYAPTAGDGLRVSNDNGASWDAVPGVPAAVEDVTFESGILWLLSDGSRWRSDNAGESWTTAATAGALNLNGAALLNRVAGQ